MGKNQKILFLILLFFSSNIFAEKETAIACNIILNLPEDIFKYCFLEKNDINQLCCLAQGLLRVDGLKQARLANITLEKIISLDSDINTNSQLSFYDILNAAAQCFSLENKKPFKTKSFWRLWPIGFRQIYDKYLCSKRENHSCLFCNLLKIHESCEEKYKVKNLNFTALNSVFLQSLRGNNFDLARIILLHGFNLKAKPDLDYTLLCFMMTEKNFKAIEFLLKNGAAEQIEQNDDNKCKINSLLCNLDDSFLYKLFKGKFL